MSPFAPSDTLMRAIEHFVRDRGFRLKHLTRGITRLSDRFLSGQRPLGEYLLMPEALASYVAYYLPINALKVRWIMEELLTFDPSFLDTPRRILDFGCGPGTGSAGLCEITQQPHEITGVDLSEPAWETAAALTEKISSFRFTGTCTPPAGPFDRLIAANVYNELEDPGEPLRLFDRVDPAGYVVLIEPALQETTRQVMTLRDRLASGGWTIAAPCLDVPACPMSAHPDIWCHQEVTWTRPGWIQRLDDRTGLDKEALKFSYLVATREGKRLQGTARLVSRLHREKGKRWGWFCGGGEFLCRAELLKRDKAEHNIDFRHARRGDVLDIEPYECALRTRIDPKAKITKRAR